MVEIGGTGEGEDGTSATVSSSRSLNEWSSSPSSAKNKRDAGSGLEPIQLCGYRLLEAVRGLCRGNYVGYNRRSDPDMQLQADDPRTSLDETSLDATAEEKYEYSSASSSSSLSSLSPKPKGKSKRLNKGTFSASSSFHRRYRRNIIDECCKKPCSPNDMLRYCGRN